ncbi:MAG: CARDB domain-containing protein [Candidatus Hodarchaeota archaeon]
MAAWADYNQDSENNLNTDSNRSQSTKSTKNKFNSQKHVLANLAAETHSYLVILMDYDPNGGRLWTSTQIEGYMGILAQYWLEASRNNAIINSKVVDWVISSYNPDWAPPGNDWHLLLRDAMEKAQAADPTIDFTHFQHVMVWINYDWLGLATPAGAIADPNGQVTLSGILIGVDPDNPNPQDNEIWGRAAHLMGYTLGLPLSYSESENRLNHYITTSPYINSKMGNYSLMGQGWRWPSGLTIHAQIGAGWFDVTQLQEVIAQGGTFEGVVRPRYLDDSDFANPSSHVQQLKIKISEDVYIGVEVIAREDEDTLLPDRYDCEGVLIYDVSPGSDEEDLLVDNLASDTPADFLWDRGQIFSRTYSFGTLDYKIEIEIKNTLNDNSVNDATVIDGIVINVTNEIWAPDLKITPWGTEASWPHAGAAETPDIWVDSPTTPLGECLYHKSGDPADCVGNGDPPLVNQENRLYARIHNVGNRVATGVTVRFYSAGLTSGVSGWTPVYPESSIVIDSLGADETREVFVTWIPTPDIEAGLYGYISYHGCVKVEIDPDSGEINTANNRAQENIGKVEVKSQNGGGELLSAIKIGNSPTFGQVNMSYFIGNPFETLMSLYIGPVKEIPGWQLEIVGAGQFHILKTGEAKPFTLTLTPKSNIVVGDNASIDISVFYVLRTHDDFESAGFAYLRKFGETTLLANAVYRANIDNLQWAECDGNIDVTGQLSSPDVSDISQVLPQGVARNIFLVLFNGTREIENATVSISKDGEFKHTFNVEGGGQYSVEAYYGGSEFLASTKWPPPEEEDAAAGDFAITLGAITIIAVVYLGRRRKSEKGI